MSLLQHLLSILPTDMSYNVDVKRFVRFFYDPSPRFDDEGSSIWLLGQEYKSPPQPITTTDREDVVEIESSTDSHEPSASEPSTVPEPDPKASRDSLDEIRGTAHPSVSNDPSDNGWPHAFLDDFESRIWMTYRSNFPPIPRSQDSAAQGSLSLAVRWRNFTEKEGFSSDTGWGCMIRSGQSLLANAMMMLHLGREWRYKPHTEQSDASILALFADHPEAPFSIHRFVNHGAAHCQKHPGQWFGPSATATCIAALSNEYSQTQEGLAGLRVYVQASTSDIYEDRFRHIASSSATVSTEESTAGPAGTTQRTIQPTLILLGIRLGIDRITPVYHEALKRSLTYPQSIGIAGGRPSSSHYFVGVQNDTFFYLDPHETRAALPLHTDPNQYTPEEVATCHTRRLRGLDVKEMDPSMLMGFLIKDEADWDDFKQRVADVRGKKIVNIFKSAPPNQGETERKEAVDEVETFDDEDDEGTEKGD